MSKHDRAATGLLTAEGFSKGSVRRTAGSIGIGISMTFALSLVAYAADQNPSRDLVPKGQEIFQKTAGGGVGCAVCHGSDAYGTSTAGNIRDATAEEIVKALRTQPSMAFIKLADDDIEALAAYLAFLKSQ